MLLEKIKETYDAERSLRLAARRLRMSEERLRGIVRLNGWPKKPRATPLGNRTQNRSIYDAIESGY
jgi:hypothetical protein